jgi:hypothetical protein
MIPGAVGHNDPEDHAASLRGSHQRPPHIVRSGIRNLDDNAAQKVAESLFAKYIRIALAIFRKFDDSFGQDVAGINTAPVSLNRRASHF